MSLTYRLRRSPEPFSSGIGADTSPLSPTLMPSVVRCSARPAMRNAEGPMSVPRRLPPSSSGTPMMCTARAFLPLFTSVTPLVGHRNALVARRDGGRHRMRMRLDRRQEIRHVVLLVDDVVCEE